MSIHLMSMRMNDKFTEVPIPVFSRVIQTVPHPNVRCGRITAGQIGLIPVNDDDDDDCSSELIFPNAYL